MTRIRRGFQISHPGARFAIGVIATLVFLCGLFWKQPILLGAGAAILCMVIQSVGETAEEQRAAAARAASRRSRRNPLESGDSQRQPQVRTSTRKKPVGAPTNTNDLVNELLSTGRYGLLLRRETNRHLTPDQIVRAIRSLDEAMSLIPAGKVMLAELAEIASSSGAISDAKPKQLARNLITVEPVYLDRYTVTNEEYQQFVDAGGYEQLEFWDEEALPALLDFVDESGCPGPRFWWDGTYQPDEERRPVVGVSWYEASAYARWVGKRLPTDAEWTKAGAWPVESAPGRIAQRRYPWGESFDLRRANLWGSGSVEDANVDEFPGGVSIGGIYQLVGNVWEWTASSLCDSADATLHVPDTMKSIRGGAYDTYFESQATCHYQSGEQPLARRRNIGFRLALPMADLAPAAPRPQVAAGGSVPVAKKQPEPAPRAVEIPTACGLEAPLSCSLAPTPEL
jgi:iron(II)-dependent oxidoreductase